MIEKNISIKILNFFFVVILDFEIDYVIIDNLLKVIEEVVVIMFEGLILDLV